MNGFIPESRYDELAPWRLLFQSPGKQLAGGYLLCPDEPPLSREEAAVAGMLPGQAVYGDNSYEPNADDHRDAERGVDEETP